MKTEAFYQMAATNPEWDKSDRVHDWRNHVPEAIKRRWDTLTVETRMVAVEMADYSAGQEERD